MDLSQLLALPGFWLGAVVFLWSQLGKFSELSSDSYGSAGAASSLLRQLKPRDLTSGGSFQLALSAFLVASILVYVLLCLLPPGVLSGYFKLAGGEPIDVDNSLYPLFIAAALVGVTQPIPGLGKFTTIQASIFHRWIGVPEKVVSTAADFALQILARCDKDNMTDQQRADALSEEIQTLLDDAWIGKVRKIVDPVFYQSQVSALKLDRDIDVAAVLSSSIREKRLVIQELVLAACVASVRSKGGRVLDELALELGVTPQSSAPTKKSSTMGGLIVIGICTLILVGILPSDVARNWIIGMLGASGFWPQTSYEASQYVLANFLPVPICAAILIVSVDFSKIENRDKIGLFNILSNFSRILLFLFLTVVVFDYLQAFYDRGVFTGDYDGSIPQFIASRLLVFSIHAVGVVIYCFALTVFLIRGNLGENFGRTVLQTATLVLIAAAAAYLLIIVRMQYQFVGAVKPGLEFTWLVLGLNVTTAILTFALVVQAVRRIAGSSPTPGNLQPPRDGRDDRAVGDAENNLGVAI